MTDCLHHRNSTKFSMRPPVRFSNVDILLTNNEIFRIIILILIPLIAEFNDFFFQLFNRSLTISLHLKLYLA